MRDTKHQPTFIFYHTEHFRENESHFDIRLIQLKILDITSTILSKTYYIFPFQQMVMEIEPSSCGTVELNPSQGFFSYLWNIILPSLLIVLFGMLNLQFWQQILYFGYTFRYYCNLYNYGSVNDPTVQLSSFILSHTFHCNFCHQIIK